MKYLLLMLCAWLVPMMTLAQEAEKPLMIIRFQGQNVAYQQSLFVAMSQALKTNPDMQFEIVSRFHDAVAGGRFAHQVAQTMVEMGLPENRILLHEEQDTQVSAPEVLLFVR